MRSIIEEIKQKTNCGELAQSLGLQLKNSGMIRCPFPGHADGDPSCKIYDDGFFCFGCGQRGSCIDLVMLVKNMDFIEAARWLTDWLGLSWPERSEETRQEYEKCLNRQQEMQTRVRLWAKSLRQMDVDYLAGRGFTENFIAERGFGYCDQKMPQDAAAARALGLLIDTKTGKEWYMPGGRLTIPLYQYGKVAQVAFHKPRGEGSGKYLYPAGWEKPLIRSFKHGEVPFLVEGVFCYYSMRQAGLPAATALGVTLSQEQKEALGKIPMFYVCFDGDDAGRAAAQRLAKEFFPAARVIELPDGKDANNLLQELGGERFTEFMLQAARMSKNYLDITFNLIERIPVDEAAQRDAVELIARLPGIDKDRAIERLYQTLKPLKVRKKTVEDIVKQAAKEQANETESGQQEEEETNYIASFPCLIDVCDSGGLPCFVVKDDAAELKTTKNVNIEGKTYSPPPREQIPWLLADAEAVARHFKEDTDKALYHALVKHFEGVSELPGPAYYKLLAWWVLHSYLYLTGEYSPYLWFYAVPERGKSRTGKAMIYLAWRGVHVESLRDAYLVRIANNFGASVFFDCMDLWEKAEKQGTEDILLLRFEKGARVPRVLYPEKGAFKDTVYYKIFGPTLIATNKPVHNILETRAVQINMPSSAKRFENDIRPDDVLGMKARLLAFRARHLTSALPEANKPAAGRLGDITKPLLQIVRLVCPEDEASFEALLSEIEDARRLEKSGGWEAKIIRVVAGLYNEVESGLPPLLPQKLILDNYNEGTREKFQLSSQGLGYRLKALGFTSRMMGSGRMGVIWDEKLLKKLGENYGLEDTSETLCNLCRTHEAPEHRHSQTRDLPETTDTITDTSKKPLGHEAPEHRRFIGYRDYRRFSEDVDEVLSPSSSDEDDELTRGAF